MAPTECDHREASNAVVCMVWRQGSGGQLSASERLPGDWRVQHILGKVGQTHTSAGSTSYTNGHLELPWLQNQWVTLTAEPMN